MTHRVRLDEAPADLTAAPTSAARRARVRIIAPGWGSSGYYGADVLERDGPTSWPVGTHSYLDHPGRTEDRDRPEGSIRNLVGRVDSTPTYEADGPGGPGLYADMSFVSWAAGVIDELREDIGVSIRGYADIEVGEREGRTGNVVTRLHEGISVDLVTRAGAGGRIVALLESAREAEPTVAVVAGEPIIPAATLREASANAIRDALANAVREQVGGDDVWVWVDDFDPDAALVRYSVETPEAMAYFEDGYALADDGSATLAGAPVEVRRQVTYVPVTPAGSDSTEESATMPDEQATTAQLSEAAGRVRESEERATAAEARATAAEAERDTLRAQTAARPIVAAVLGESATLVPSTVARVTEAVLAAVPMTDGKLDETATRNLAAEARTAAETEAAEIALALGAGAPRGLPSWPLSESGGPAAQEVADTLAALDQRIDRKNGVS